jgi:hypothetical protein
MTTLRKSLWTIIALIAIAFFIFVALTFLYYKTGGH